MLLKLCKGCYVKEQLFARPLLLKRCERSIFGFGKKKEPEEVEPIASPVLEEQVTVMSEEQIMKIRDKSRLPALIKSELTGNNVPEMTYLWQFKKQAVRRRYATYGRASGLKPGVCWPSKEELQYIKGYEKAFHPPLNEMVEKVSAIREEELRFKKKREKEILANLKQLPKWKQEFWDKYKKMHDDIENEKLKKEKLIQEVREFVGYDLDPKDPRFEEALIKKDEEMKKLSKAARKQEKQRQALERLQALATEAMEREKDEEKTLEKSKTHKQVDNQKQELDTNQTTSDPQNK